MSVTIAEVPNIAKSATAALVPSLPISAATAATAPISVASPATAVTLDAMPATVVTLLATPATVVIRYQLLRPSADKLLAVIDTSWVARRHQTLAFC